MSTTILKREELKDFLLTLVTESARTVMPYFRQPLGIENKRADENGYDPVTVADREAEQVIRRAIEQSYPSHSIYGEEFPNKEGTATYSWVIDPIDGTRGFVCGLPTWATLIAVCEDGTPILGVMAQPLVGDIFLGGMGCAELTNNGRATQLKTRVGQTLGESVLFAATPDMFSDTELAAFNTLSGHTQMTRFGVDSYAYCLLAAGYVDLVVESGLGFYDVAALIPLVETAGGVVTDWEGRPVRGPGRVIAAANKDLHIQALEILQQQLAASAIA